MPMYSVELQLKEPLTLGMSPAVGNDVATLEFVPATSLRGAIAGGLARRSAQPRLDTLFGHANPRWSPAFPVEAKDKCLCVPMPACFVEDKGNPEFGVLNTARESVRTLGEYRKISPGPEEYQEMPDGVIFQWQRVKGQWLAIDHDGNAVRAVRVPKATHMHVALHYGRQSHRPGALFSRTGIEGGKEIGSYRAFVADPESVILQDEKLGQVFMGKRRSAGNGAVGLTWNVMPRGKPVWPGEPVTGHSALLQLMTDTILSGANGGSLRTVAGETLTKCCGFPQNLEVEVVASGYREYPGWSNQWGLPRESTLVVDAGSVFRIICDHARFAASMDALAASGLGVRRNEGFGWVAVNPQWLTETLLPSSILAAVEFGQPHNWPGFLSSNRPRLRSLAEEAERLAQRSALTRQRLRDLAAYSQRVRRKEDVLIFLDRMANRTNPRKWDEARVLLSGPISKGQSLHEARFLLEAAATFAAPED